ncbi:hypothetical protein C8R45DRAFT_1075141 [Mycena sanguinolenta]|nr:hypothetical protein C8R45DRAFT_1075141 [Mycena sanguinolenta]
MASRSARAVAAPRRLVVDVDGCTCAAGDRGSRRRRGARERERGEQHGKNGEGIDQSRLRSGVDGVCSAREAEGWRQLLCEREAWVTGRRLREDRRGRVGKNPGAAVARPVTWRRDRYLMKVCREALNGDQGRPRWRIPQRDGESVGNAPRTERCERSKKRMSSRSMERRTHLGELEYAGVTGTVDLEGRQQELRESMRGLYDDSALYRRCSERTPFRRE